jgi:hypothetical protein
MAGWHRRNGGALTTSASNQGVEAPTIPVTMRPQQVRNRLCRLQAAPRKAHSHGTVADPSLALAHQMQICSAAQNVATMIHVMNSRDV